MNRHPLVDFGWAPGEYWHTKCTDCDCNDWMGDKYAWRCEQCATKAMERYQAKMDEDDRDEKAIADDKKPTPITFEELARRGMDARLAEIIQTAIGDFFVAMPGITLTKEEMAALGYGKTCPCGERGLKANEKLCGCGDSCQECCDQGKCDCKCGDSCPCKV